MSLAWQVVKAVSRLQPHWRANIKQYENFQKQEHYYSPIPLISEVCRAESRIFDTSRRVLAGIDVQENEQLQVLEEVAGYYGEIAFTESASPAARYHYDNKFFPYTDGILYYGMLRRLCPERVIEVGCGYSSAVCLDTNDRFFGSAIRCTFIEPDTSRLDSLLTATDRLAVDVKRQQVQDVPLGDFGHLGRNDILFIDSSHVCKVGSDVNRILFEILPSLASGVHVHFHDIFYPFEYPRDWIFRGVAWNEAYALRAFLQYNSAFRIVVWADYLQRFHSEKLM
jgi:hypothetical protein